MGYGGEFDPGQGRVVDHVFAGDGRFEAFGMPYPLHFDPRIDQKGVKILFEIHIRKAKRTIRAVDRGGGIDLVIDPYFTVDDPVPEGLHKIGSAKGFLEVVKEKRAIP